MECGSHWRRCGGPCRACACRSGTDGACAARGWRGGGCGALGRGQAAPGRRGKQDRCAPATGAWRAALGGRRHQSQGQGALAQRGPSEAFGGLGHEQRFVAARRGPARGRRGDIPVDPRRRRGARTHRDPGGSECCGRRGRSPDGDAKAGPGRPRGIPRLAIRAGEGRGRKRGLGRYCEPAGAGAVDCQGFVGAGGEPPLRKALRQFSRWRAGLDAVPYQARQAVHPDLAQGFDREGR